jgi:tetratricopeptide (TPR) repeat protein
MNPEQWRILGRLEARFEENKKDISRAMELADFLMTIEGGADPLLAFLDQIKPTFDGKFKFHELEYKAYKLAEKEERANTAYDKAIKLHPADTDELRKILLLLRERNLSDQGQKTIEKFESKNGKSVDSLWMKADLFASLGKHEIVRAIQEEIAKLPETVISLVAQSALLLAYPQEKDKNWVLSQKLIIKALTLDPKMTLPYRVLFFGSMTMEPKKETLAFAEKKAIEHQSKNAIILIELLRLKLNFSLELQNEKLFEELKSVVSPHDLPILQIIHHLCCDFDNIGLARQFFFEWLNPNTNGPRLSVKVKDFAIEFSRPVTEIEIQIPKKYASDPKIIIESLKNIALKAMQRLLFHLPTNPDAHYQMGMYLLSINDPRAFSHFQRAVELKHDHVDSQLQIAKIKDTEGNEIEAYEIYRKITQNISSEPETAVEAIVNASEIAIKYGWVEEGEELLEKARMILPNNYRVTTMLAKVYLKEAKIIGSDYALMQAEQHFKKSLLFQPNNPDVNYYLGQVYYNKRQYLEAIRQFSDTLNKFPEKSTLCNFWISRSYHQLFKNILFSSKDFITNAIKYAENLRQIGDKIPEILEYLAQLYFESGKKEESKVLMEACKMKIIKKSFTPIFPKLSGEARVLAVYAPQIIRGSDPTAPPERLFSKGSLGTIEVSYIPGSGGLLVTGNLGESFQNSIEVAYAYFKNYLQKNGLMQDPSMDLHIDVPGWIPKYDGPSAGVAIACSMISAYTDKPIPKNITLTGEISMHGRVMPVGGIKEKVEATYGKGIDKIFIPRDNKWDYLDMLLKGTTTQGVSIEDEIEDDVESQIIIAVSSIDEIVSNLGIGVDESMIPKDEKEIEEKPRKKRKGSMK